MAKNKQMQKPTENLRREAAKMKTDGPLQTASEAPKPSENLPKETPEDTAVLTADLETAAQANTELQAENEALVASNTQLTNANIELQGRIEPLSDNLGQTQVELAASIKEADSLKQSNVEVAKMNQTILTLTAELAAAKMESLPQAINLDVLAAAAFQRSPQCSPKNAAKLACELHNELIARCSELAAIKETQGGPNVGQE